VVVVVVEQWSCGNRDSGVGVVRLGSNAAMRWWEGEKKRGGGKGVLCKKP